MIIKDESSGFPGSFKFKHVPNKGDEARFSYFDQKSVQLSTIPKVVVGTMRFQTPYLEHGYSNYPHYLLPSS
jgi:hypothetical protein